MFIMFKNILMAANVILGVLKYAVKRNIHLFNEVIVLLSLKYIVAYFYTPEMPFESEFNDLNEINYFKNSH